MIAICPTVTATDRQEYRQQIERLAPFAHRVHIDLMDGEFAPTLSPSLPEIWWPETMLADLHLMFKAPTQHTQEIIHLKPHLAIVHAEAEGDLVGMAHELHSHGVNVGVAILAETQVHAVGGILEVADHVLIFSGHLGFHGGEVNTILLSKIDRIRERNPNAAIAWDGGINNLNAGVLLDAGVTVLNVGGYIQGASDPQAAYAKIEAVVQEKML